MDHRSVVTCFLERDGKILLLRRSDRVTTYQGRWAGVSGSIDAGNTPERQAWQEIREETGLTAADVRLVANGDPIDFVDEAIERSWTVHPFRFMVVQSAGFHTDWEHVESRWINPSELASYETVPHLRDAWESVADPARNTERGMMVQVSELVKQRIAAIGGDVTHGASSLSREALRTVGACAREAVDGSAAEVLQRVHECIDELGRARTEMAPIRSWVERLRAEIDRASVSTTDATALREAILQSVDRLVEASERANQQVIENAVDRLSPDSVIFTASYSQTVVNACRLASERGKLRTLLVSESLDAEGRRHGRLLAAAMGEVNASIEVIPDDLAPGRVAEADRVWIGADSVLPDGSVLNGTPSRAIAEAAFGAGRPVEIIAEAAKIQTAEHSDEEEKRRAEAVTVPAGMDRVPSELISAVITENGAVQGRASPSRLLSSLAEPKANTDAMTDRVAQVAQLLADRKELVGVVETAMGGHLSDVLTDRPGSSAWFAGGIVAYSGASVRDLAGVPAETVKAFGAVSVQTAQALADAARERFGCAWGVGETGIAGPQTGRRSAKPAGLAYLAVSGPNDRRIVVELTTGRDERPENKRLFALAALNLLVRELRATEERRNAGASQ